MNSSHLQQLLTVVEKEMRSAFGIIVTSQILWKPFNKSIIAVEYSSKFQCAEDQESEKRNISWSVITETILVIWDNTGIKDVPNIPLSILKFWNEQRFKQ